MIAVLKFPGTNGDHDVIRALELAGLRGEIVWYKDYAPGRYDAVVLAGGFSYGDRLRAGVVAAATKAVEHVREDAERATPVLGICNGFQILVEAGMLPGALAPNDPPGFISKWIPVRVVDNETPFTLLYQRGEVVYMPVAHAEGRYIPVGAPRVAFKYVENPNGSVDDIAGVAQGSVLGLMPHPERAVDPHVSRNGVGGLKLWLSLKEWLKR